MSSLKTLLEHRKLTDLIIESQSGEVTPENELVIQKLEQELLKKPDSIAAVLNDFDAIALDLKNKIKDFQAALKFITNERERLENLTIQNLLTNNLIELVGEKITLKIQRTQGSLKITNEELATELYGEPVTSIVVSNEKIKNDLKNGINLNCAIIEQGWSLRTKVNKGAK
jgi:hypothetical protein